MIYDGMSAIGLYQGMSQGLDKLIDWLESNEIRKLPTGITEIDGQRVFATVMDAKTRRVQDARFETHHRYIDVQVDLEGSECFKTTPGAVVPLGEFDENADKGYCKAAQGNDDLLEGTLEDDHFAVFMVGEPHMPNLVVASAEVGDIKKVCFKVLDDRFWTGS